MTGHPAWHQTTRNKAEKEKKRADERVLGLKIWVLNYYRSCYIKIPRRALDLRKGNSARLVSNTPRPFEKKEKEKSTSTH